MGSVMRSVYKLIGVVFGSTTDFIAARVAPSRRFEVRHTMAGIVAGMAFGALFLSTIGGVGVSAHGGAAPAPVTLVAVIMLALVGNRWGVELDLRALKAQVARQASESA